MSKADNCPACHGTLSKDACLETFTPEERGFKEYYYLQNPEVVARTIYPTHDYVNEGTTEMSTKENPRIAMEITDPVEFLEVIANRMQTKMLSNNEVQSLGEDVEHLANRIREQLEASPEKTHFFNKDNYFIASEGIVTDDKDNQTNLSTENVFAVVPRLKSVTGKPSVWESVTAQLIVSKEPKPWTLEEVQQQLVIAASNLPTGMPFESTEFQRQHIEALANLYHITAKLALRNY